MTIIEWMNNNYFITWSALWLGYPIIFAIWSISYSILFKLPNRILRTIKVICRGYPPAHLDEDGDPIKYKDIKEELKKYIDELEELSDALGS